MGRWTLSAIVAAVAIVLGGCALAVHHPSVAELQHNPGRYYDRTVAVDGVVTSSWGIPLMPVQMYRVNDGTGEVTVLSQHGRTPARGAHVRVKGKVEQVAVFGGRSLGLHIREDDVHFDRGRW